MVGAGSASSLYSRRGALSFEIYRATLRRFASARFGREAGICDFMDRELGRRDRMFCPVMFCGDAKDERDQDEGKRPLPRR